MVYFLDLVGFVSLPCRCLSTTVCILSIFHWFFLPLHWLFYYSVHTDRLGPSSNDYFTVLKYLTRLNVIVSCRNVDVGGCAAAVLKSIISASYLLVD